MNLTESSELPEITANHPNSAQSTPPSGEYCEIRAFCTQQNKKVMNYYAHIAHITHILLHIIICMHIFLHTCRLVLDIYNFTISTVFYIEFNVLYTKSYNHFRTIVLNSLTPVTYKNKITNVVGTQGSIQFICRPIALHSNILNLAKSPIGIGMVRLAPILLSQISETSWFLGLLLACHSRKSSWISLCSTSLTNIHSHCTH